MTDSPQRPLRVLFVNRMASLERGGGETFDLEISRHLEKLGCQVSYLTGLPIFSGARTPVCHPRAHTLRTPSFNWVPWDVMKGGWRLRVLDVDLFSRAAARWALRHASAFDVVQVCELPTFVHAWKQQGSPAPVVIRLTAPNFYDPRGAIGRADAVMASGTTVAALRAGPLPGVVDVPNGVDTAQFRPGLPCGRAQWGLPADAFALLYVARFQAFKNHALLIRAFARLHAQCPRALLLLAGSGPLRARVEEQARQAGLADAVRFLGEVPFNRLPDLYGAADLKVISSDYESFCFAAIEAMSCGLPLVTTDGGWLPNLVGGGEVPPTARGAARVAPGGLIVPVGDEAALAAAVLDLERDAPARAAMGAWNRARAVERHGWEGSARRLLALYQRLVPVGRGP